MVLLLSYIPVIIIFLLVVFQSQYGLIIILKLMSKSVISLKNFNPNMVLLLFNVPTPSICSNTKFQSQYGLIIMKMQLY